MGLELRVRKLFQRLCSVVEYCSQLVQWSQVVCTFECINWRVVVDGFREPDAVTVMEKNAQALEFGAEL